MSKKKKWLSFEEAREYVRSLKLSSFEDWRELCSSGNKPDDIPSNPHVNYSNCGWGGYKDWLGIEFLSFEEAREYVRSLKLKCREEWSIYCKSGRKSINIPYSPNYVYKGKGWIDWDDWLGGKDEKFILSFKDARKFARTLKLRGSKDWNEFCKSGKKPDNLPSKPNIKYKDKGWISWGDWLGTRYIANQKREWLSFEEARDYVRGLELKSRYMWEFFSKSKKRPKNIPSNPHVIYNDRGWLGYRDWLGY